VGRASSLDAIVLSHTARTTAVPEMLTDTIQRIRLRSMAQLSQTGLRAVEEISQRTGFSRDAVTSMLLSLMAGRGGMAQFSHSEFGGSGQWMADGPIMISDMFNNALKARVDALCNELSALIRSEPDFVTAASFQSQSQGAPRKLRRESSSHMVTDGPDQANWWPADLGVPSSLGAQNEVRYAYFPATQRLAIDMGGKVTVYDTQDHQISGFSQQQPGLGSLGFSSQLGNVDMSHLPVVSDANGVNKSPKPMHGAAAEQEVVTSKASARTRRYSLR
jgi:hypothetical protein